MIDLDDRQSLSQDIDPAHAAGARLHLACKAAAGRCRHRQLPTPGGVAGIRRFLAGAVQLGLGDCLGHCLGVLQQHLTALLRQRHLGGRDGRPTVAHVRHGFDGLLVAREVLDLPVRASTTRSPSPS